MSQESKNLITTLWYQLNAIKKGASRPKDVAPQQSEEGGHPRRRHDGRRHRLRVGQGRHRRGAARQHAGAGRQRQGVLARPARRAPSRRAAARPRSATRIWPRSRPPPATTSSRAATWSSKPCSRTAPSRPSVTAKAEKQHRRQRRCLPPTPRTLPITGLAKASERPENFIGLHFFSPGGQDAAGGDHRRQGDQRRDAGQGLRLRAADRQDADRGERLARLLHQPRVRHLRDRRHRDAQGGRAPAQHRGGRPAGRHADAAAGAAGRSEPVALPARAGADAQGPGRRRQDAAPSTRARA